MIYMAEIKEDNICSLREIFGKNANIIEGDFRSYYSEGVLFDYIIGNPPYNVNGIKKVPTNTEKNKKYEDGETIWISFIKKAISLLKTNGQLSMIVPSIWLKPDKAKTYHYLTNYKIEKLNCLTNTETNKLFHGNAQTPTCYFLLTKTNNNNNNSLKKEISIFDTDKGNYISFIFSNENPEQPIPLFGASIISKLIPYVNKYGYLRVKKTNLPSSKSLFKDDIQSAEKNGYSYKNIKTCVLDKKSGLIPELVVNYSNIPQAYYGKSKLVLAHKMYGFPYMDYEGGYGISNRDNYVILLSDYQNEITSKKTDTIDDKENDIKLLNRLKDFLSTQLILYIYESTRYRMKYLEKYAFEFIPDITQISNFPKIITDETVSAYFNLSKEEVNAINKLHKKEYKNFK